MGTYKTKQKKIDIKIKLFRDFLETKFGIVLSNWIFQGILYMEVPEKIFKIFFELVLFCLIFILLHHASESIIAVLLISLSIAHTANWLLNGHFFVLGRYLGITHTSPQRFIEYPERIKRRLISKKSIEAVAFFGSLSRGTFSSTSDLDIRIIRRKGILNSFLACFWGFTERSRSLFCKYPLDLYVIRHKYSLEKISKDEKPIMIFDKTGFFKKLYKSQYEYNEFRAEFLNRYAK